MSPLNYNVYFWNCSLVLVSNLPANLMVSYFFSILSISSLISLNIWIRLWHSLWLTVWWSAVFRALGHRGFFLLRLLMVAHSHVLCALCDLISGTSESVVWSALAPDLPLLCWATWGSTVWDYIRWSHCECYVASGSEPLGVQGCVQIFSGRILFCTTQSQGQYREGFLLPSVGQILFLFFAHWICPFSGGSQLFGGSWSDLPPCSDPELCSHLPHAASPGLPSSELPGIRDALRARPAAASLIF